MERVATAGKNGCHTRLFSDGGGTPNLNRLLLLFLVLFWTNGMSVIPALHTGWVIGGFNGASARTLLEPFGTTDASEGYESFIL